MKLEVKHFTSDKRVDICDEFGNVLRRVFYDDPQIDIGTSMRVRSWMQGFVEGWERARHAIGPCVADDRIIDTEKQIKAMIRWDPKAAFKETGK